MFWTMIPAGYISTWKISCSSAAIGIGSSSIPSPIHCSTPAGRPPFHSSIMYMCQASWKFTMALFSLPASVMGIIQLVPGRFMLYWYGPISVALWTPGMRVM